MKVSASMSSLADTRWHQYAVRFALGGLITVIAGLIAQHFGPVVGGLFLAFPAIFPAGATLVAKRERQKKARAGLSGATRGRRAAALDASGTVLGAVALMCFAIVVWRALPDHRPALVLGVAAIGWASLSIALWWLRKKHWWMRGR